MTHFCFWVRVSSSARLRGGSFASHPTEFGKHLRSSMATSEFHSVHGLRATYSAVHSKRDNQIDGLRASVQEDE